MKPVTLSEIENILTHLFPVYLQHLPGSVELNLSNPRQTLFSAICMPSPYGVMEPNHMWLYYSKALEIVSQQARLSYSHYTHLYVHVRSQSQWLKVAEVHLPGPMPFQQLALLPFLIYQPSAFVDSKSLDAMEMEEI